jgi:hypothetical protein
MIVTVMRNAENRPSWLALVLAAAVAIGSACGGGAANVADGGPNDTGGGAATGGRGGGGGTGLPDSAADVTDGGGAADLPDVASGDGAHGPDGGSGDIVARPDALAFDGIVDGGSTSCNDLPNTAPVVAPVLRGQAATPPELQGGTISDGRYELVSVDDYADVLSRASVPSAFQRTIEFRQGGTDWQLVEVARVDTSETSWTVVRRAYGVVTTADGTLTATLDACSDNGAASTVYRFQAGTDTVAMYLANTRLLLSYQRVP